MKKKIIFGMVVLLSATTMAGCGNAIPEMSEQQRELVVEYAVGVLLKHDWNYGTRLVDFSKVQESDPEEMSPESGGEQEAAQAQEETEPDVSDVEVVDNTGYASIEDFLKSDPVHFTYTGYETVDFYPDEGEGIYFMMNATEGNKLLVLKFQAENPSGAETALDIAQSETRFKIVVDGERKNAMTTMLSNDLAYYQGTLAAGESRELVLICEIPEEQATALSSLEIFMRNADGTATIPLQSL